MDELKMISEIDIKDMIELYKLQKGDTFLFADDYLHIPPDSNDLDPLKLYKFLGVDGMYAKIRQVSAPVGTLDFVAAWTKVRKA